MLSTDRKCQIISISDSLQLESAEKFIRQLDELIQLGTNEIVLNCSELHNVTSKSIGALLVAFDFCSKKGVSCRISSPTTSLTRTIRALDLDLILLPAEAVDETTLLLRQIRAPIDENLSFEKDFKAEAADIQETLCSLNLLLKKKNWPESLLSDICTIFYEISTNVRIHGAGNSTNIIRFSLKSHRNGLQMQFIDNGPPFDPTAYKPYDDVVRAAKSGKTRGFGILLVRRLADKMEYRREHGTANVLRIEKRWNCV